MLKMGKFWFFMILAVTSATAIAGDAYKCVGNDGKVSFASQPCAPGQGVSTWLAHTQHTELHSLVPQDASADAINKRATRILRTSYRAAIHYKVSIVPAAGQKTP